MDSALVISEEICRSRRVLSAEVDNGQRRAPSQHNLVFTVSRSPSFFLVIACTIDVISKPDITNAFEIWSKLASSEGLTGEYLSQSETEKMFQRIIDSNSYMP